MAQPLRLRLSCKESQKLPAIETGMVSIALLRQLLQSNLSPSIRGSFGEHDPPKRIDRANKSSQHDKVKVESSGCRKRDIRRGTSLKPRCLQGNFDGFPKNATSIWPLSLHPAAQLFTVLLERVHSSCKCCTTTFNFTHSHVDRS